MLQITVVLKRYFISFFNAFKSIFQRLTEILISCFVGADLSNLVNQAAIRAAVESEPYVTMKHLEWAKDKIIMGRCIFIIYQTKIFPVRCHLFLKVRCDAQ